MFVSENIFKYR
jgi:hypothetical protein